MTNLPIPQNRRPPSRRLPTRLRWLLPVVPLAVLVPWRAAGADSLESWQSCCGAVCLRTAAGLLGDPTGLAQVREILQPNSLGETSLAEIAQAATQMGFHAAGLSLKAEVLELCSVPLIAHQPPDHFVVLLGLGQGQGVLLLDPPRDARRMTNEQMYAQRYWHVVAVSREPLDTRGFPSGRPQDDRMSRPPQRLPQEQAGLRFESPVWHFGSIRPSTRKTHTFRFTNLTGRPVLLTRVKANCACVKIIDFAQEVPPGQTGTLEIGLDPGGLEGYVAKRLVVVTGGDAGQEQAVILEVLGEVTRRGELVVDPRQILLPDLVRGTTVQKTVRLKRLGYEGLQLQRIKTSHPNVAVLKAENVVGSSSEAELQVRIEAPPALGPFACHVIFETADAEYPSVELQIRGDVVSHLRPDPPALFLGLVSTGADIGESTSLVSRTGTPFEIRKTEVDVPGLSATYEPARGDKTRWTVTLHALSRLNAGILQGKIRIWTDDPDTPTVEVPVMGLKKG
jgi:predicted double-glycine peptidase